MAQGYEFFNPDVAGVPIPDTNVTRPISPLKPDLSGEYIGKGIGTALKDTGELVKDTTKLIDYTNKQELENRVHASTDPEREAFTRANLGMASVAEEVANRSSGATPGDVTGAIAASGAANPSSPDAPVGLSDIPKKVNNAKAMKEQGAQSEMYYRGRINQLAKEYRQAFPQYRDYIDHVFSKAGFGNPANEYIASIQRYRNALEAASKGGEDKDTERMMSRLQGDDGAKYNSFFGEGWSAQTAHDLRAGKINAYQVQAQVQKAETAYWQNEKNRAAIQNTDKDSKERAVRYITDDVAQKVAGRMQTPEVQSMMEALSKPIVDLPPDVIQQYGARLQQMETEIRNQTQVSSSIQIPEYHTDAFGRTKDASGKPYTTGKMISPLAVAGSEYKTAVDTGLSSFIGMKEALIGNNPVLAKQMGLINQGLDDRAVYNLNQITGGAAANAKALATAFPTWWLQENSNYMTKMGLLNFDSIQKAMALSMSSGVQQGVAYSKILNNVKANGAENPAVNKFTWDQALNRIKSSGTPKEVVEPSILSIYDKGLIGNVSTDVLTQRFAEMTDQPAILAIKGSSPPVQQQANEWILTAGSQGIARPVLQNLQRLEQEQGSVAGNYKIHYNDATHTFGVDAFGIHNITVEDLGRLGQGMRAGRETGADIRSISAVRNVLQNVMPPMNTVTTGYANMMKSESPERINSVITSEIRRATTGQNKITQALEQQGAARAKEKADAAKAKEEKKE